MAFVVSSARSNFFTYVDLVNVYPYLVEHWPMRERITFLCSDVLSRILRFSLFILFLIHFQAWLLFKFNQHRTNVIRNEFIEI